MTLSAFQAVVTGTLQRVDEVAEVVNARRDHAAPSPP